MTDLELEREENNQDKLETMERCIRFYNSPVLAMKDHASTKDAIFAEVARLIDRIENRHKDHK